MAYTPENSRIKVDTALEERISKASAAEIGPILRAAAISQHAITPDWDPELYTENPVAPEPKGYVRVVIIDGRKTIVEADSELSLEKSVGDLYRAAMAQPATSTQQIEQPRNERGQFVSAEDAAATAELELQFKRGEISASDYLQKSGAVADYLAKQGIPLQDLRAQVAEKQSERFTQDWASATEEFLHSPEGSDWIGGEENKNILGRLIAENQLIDQPSAATLAKVWNHMKENSLAVKNADASYQRDLQEAQSPSEIAAVNHKYFGGSGSGLFNR